jgi:site-specific DNA recombinase
MKLIGYCRVSTDAQSDNTSLADQRKKIESYCVAMGHELLEVFEEVYSGKNAKDRPIYQEALNAVLDRADGIIAAKLDRIGRNTRDVLALVEDTLQPNDKVLVLLDVQVDTSTMTGEMILTVMASIATLERKVIRERTQGGRKSKHAAGGFAYGSPAYGWKSNDDQELVKNPTEQEVIEIIRKHRKSGKSYAEIAKYLNKEGFPAKQGGEWSSGTVNVVYKRQCLSKLK